MRMNWWSAFQFLIGKSLCSTGTVLRVEWKATRDGRLSSSHCATLAGKIQMKKNSVMITRPFKVHNHARCTSYQDAVYWVKFREHNNNDCNFGKQSHMRSSYTILCTRMHLQSNISERRSNAARKTQPTTRAESHMQSQLAFVAAAAISFWCCVDWYKDTCSGANLEKICQRQHNGWSDQFTEICTGSQLLASCWEKASVWTWSPNRRSYPRCFLTRCEERWMKSTKSWHSSKSDHAQNQFVTICRKVWMIFSEEASRATYKMGNMEWIELRQTSCWKMEPQCRARRGAQNKRENGCWPGLFHWGILFQLQVNCLP